MEQLSFDFDAPAPRPSVSLREPGLLTSADLGTSESLFSRFSNASFFDRSFDHYERRVRFSSARDLLSNHMARWDDVHYGIDHRVDDLLDQMTYYVRVISAQTGRTPREFRVESSPENGGARLIAEW